MKIPGIGFLRFHLLTKQLAALDVRIGQKRLPALAASIHRLEPLTPVPGAPAPRHEVVYLTGERFLYQTVFSAYSLFRASGLRFNLRIINDGSLSANSLALLEKLFPGVVQIEATADQEARIERLFPRDRFPCLRQSRDEGALFRKLLDVHGGRSGWTLFIDSDTYFHRNPKELLDCMEAASRPCFMQDHWSNYGHAPEFVDEVAGHPIIRLINSGLVGLRSEQIDWDKLERWLAAMRSRPGRSVFFEQGLTAMLLSSLPDPLALPPCDYALSPGRREVLRPSAAFHHYAGESKYRFIRYNVPAPLFNT